MCGEAVAPHPLSLTATNTNSLLPKMSELMKEVEDFHPDIITITESKLRPGIQDADIFLPSYQLLRQDRPGDTRSGGVVIYVKDHLVVQPIKVTFPKSQILIFWAAHSSQAVAL